MERGFKSALSPLRPEGEGAEVEGQRAEQDFFDTLPDLYEKLERR
jgi:hypothetical protein